MEDEVDLVVEPGDFVVILVVGLVTFGDKAELFFKEGELVHVLDGESGDDRIFVLDDLQDLQIVLHGQVGDNGVG